METKLIATSGTLDTDEFQMFSEIVTDFDSLILIIRTTISSNMTIIRSKEQGSY